MCHSNADRGRPPNLLRMNESTHTAFEAIVLRGALRPLGMPQFDDVLTVKDVKAIHAAMIDLARTAFIRQSESDQ